MQDILIPLGLLLFIALFAFAMVHTARSQRQAKAKLFRDLAGRHSLDYLEKDDGRVQAFARDFDGLNRFYSPSRGEVIPKDVVHGRLDGTEVILFRHSIRFGEGWAREWFVAGLTAAQPLGRCAIQFCRSGPDRQSMYLSAPVIKEYGSAGFTLVVRGADAPAAGHWLEAGTLDELAGLAAGLPFRPELQVHDRHLVAYLADRNAEPGDMADLEALLHFAQHAARLQG